MEKNPHGVSDVPPISKSYELNDAERLIFQEKLPVALIFILETRITYISEVSTAINSNFAHTKKVITRLENLDLVSSFMQGRTRYLHLTPKGYYLAELLKSVRSVINKPAEEFEFPTDSSQESSYFSNVSQEDKYLKDLIEVETPVYTEDPVLLKQIINVSSHINEIYKEWNQNSKDDKELLHSQLGPLDRELKRIEQLIYQKGINSPTLLENFKKLSETYSKYMSE
ncbi:MAG: hypothetical protein GX362_04255 [Methanosarcinaceae archaeon]|nr:hypothetical protein [Methanosarcinaceae archaeon]